MKDFLNPTFWSRPNFVPFPLVNERNILLCSNIIVKLFMTSGTLALTYLGFHLRITVFTAEKSFIGKATRVNPSFVLSFVRIGGATTISKMTLSIMALSILSLHEFTHPDSQPNDTQPNDIQRKGTQHNKAQRNY
jgi:hypothetical protein